MTGGLATDDGENRREGRVGNASTMASMARSASAISAALIIWKSVVCSSSAAELVIDMSISMASESFLFGVCGVRRAERLVDAPRGRLLILSGIRLAGQRRQQKVTHLFHQPRIAPENVKGLIKDQPVFGMFHTAARQRVIEFHTVADIDGLAGLDTFQGRRRPDAKPGTPRTRTKCAMF